MNIRIIVLLLIGGFLLIACVPKQYVKQNSALIVFKTPTFRYADMGFIYENKEEIKVEIYESGQPLMSLEILNDKVCMSLLECMSKESFNKKVLSGMYPEDILENIFRGKAIFNADGLEKNSNGFTQRLRSKNKYDIHYTVLNKQILFRDTMNGILIKVEKQ